MNSETIDPMRVRVSDFNERKENIEVDVGDDSLLQSVSTVGVKQPPIVRPDTSDDDEYDYEVIAGHRRVLAAQRAERDVPVVVAEWDDEESLVTSITENLSAFRKEVSPKDRARAVMRLWEMMGGEGKPSATELSERIGCSKASVSQWLEPYRDEWKGTKVDPDNEDSVEGTSLSGQSIAEIRKATADLDTEQREEALSLAEEHSMTKEEIRTYRKYIEKGATLPTACKWAVRQEDPTDDVFTDMTDQIESSETPQEAPEEEGDNSVPEDPEDTTPASEDSERLSWDEIKELTDKINSGDKVTEPISADEDEEDAADAGNDAWVDDLSTPEIDDTEDDTETMDIAFSIPVDVYSNLQEYAEENTGRVVEAAIAEILMEYFGMLE